MSQIDVQRSASIRTLIVDDHAIVVAGLERVLQNDARIQIVGRAQTVAEAGILIRRSPPDLILLDLKLPDSSGAATIATVRAACPGACIVALTAYATVTEAEAVRSGADVLLDKGTASDVIVQTIQRLLPPRPGGGPLEATLSPRETEVARIAAEGLTNAEIAEALHVSENTVKTHLAHILDKLGLRNRTDLASFWHSRVSGNRADTSPPAPPRPPE